MKLYQVIVGNIGLVCNTCIRDIAVITFKHYFHASTYGGSSASGENVTLFADGEIEAEYVGGGRSDFKMFTCGAAAYWAWRPVTDTDPKTGRKYITVTAYHRRIGQYQTILGCSMNFAIELADINRRVEEAREAEQTFSDFEELDPKEMQLLRTAERLSS